MKRVTVGILALTTILVWLNSPADAQGDIQHQVLFEQPLGTLRPLVMSAVTGIDHDA